jgi:class 3 adenylate cyclase
MEIITFATGRVYTVLPAVKTGIGGTLIGRGARVARRLCQFAAGFVATQVPASSSTRSITPSGICRKRVPTAWKASGSPLQRKS